MLELYQQAAGRNDTEGLMGLAWMHAHGQGSVNGTADKALALSLYWQACAQAPDAKHAAAPLLMYLCLRLTMSIASATKFREAGDVGADLYSLVVLLLTLCIVLWLKHSRGWLGGREHIQAA